MLFKNYEMSINYSSEPKSYGNKMLRVSKTFDLQDLPNALNDAAVAEGLGLANLKTRDWAIFKTSAIKGEGLFEGLDWLSNMLKTRRRWMLRAPMWQGMHKMCYHSWAVCCETAICHDDQCFVLFVGSTDVYACWVWGVVFLSIHLKE